MPSGNAWYVNKTDAELEVGGQAFAPGEATHVIDNGIISLLEADKAFAKAKAPKEADPE